MSTLTPRVVIVSRRSELDELLARHGTRGAAAYFLKQRGRDLDEVSTRHEALREALTQVGAAIPADWRRGHVERADLPRFLFAPEDVVIAVGQDGLVANVAKYLDGQPVIGVDPEPGRNPGVLVRHPATAVGRLLRGSLPRQQRTMVVARLDDGQELAGLNEIYIGHAGHQSARYVITTPDGTRERQSSSGLIVGTGTGATGWCASIARDRATAPPLPAPADPALCWFVREAWPSPVTGVSCVSGLLTTGQELELTSESERLVVFADGLESDALELSWGQRVRVSLAPRHLSLV
ncbi:inorganic polyphosphate/ATP-NAD kinase [Actinoplanes sp. SE50]|uniref:inorganic polyphosphate/ATP-NAD kinase n=1 Tax=unclassified Actinoplanes TaxID=2626549 RepID=UPI00023EC092|nr:MULTISPECIES: inorganic polyphosphate/ATP-NAD kinase [unclassified Actinoplanes]AEV83510.1 putative inorganic polyphosphate/ATP-NAD kinase [Actinoplanes sp. SE50/110]ATO82346.1 inorganic polyphosphate/ATP-NAD kinase [Actinoplanes sp. SE50]SLL99753.1 inorganic polyphosphate/ATP-NAD kinase [Actinoplanes sp. SE50/110]